jgi:hypothetical protein
MAATAAVADVVRVIATVIGAVLDIDGNLATARRVRALLVLLDLHDGSPGPRDVVMRLPA